MDGRIKLQAQRLEFPSLLGLPFSTPLTNDQSFQLYLKVGNQETSLWGECKHWMPEWEEERTKGGEGTEKMERGDTQDKKARSCRLACGPARFLLASCTQLPRRVSDYRAGGKACPDFCLLKSQMK